MRRIEALYQRWSTTPPWTFQLGVARTALALGTLFTLLMTDTSDLFGGTMGPTRGACGASLEWALFCRPEVSLGIAKWVAIAVLAVVASGFRPRLTAIPHWYVAASFSSSGFLIDGSDHIATTLSALLIPLCLTDGRVWHWRTVASPSSAGVFLGAITGHSWLWVLRLQVAALYLHAAAAKISVAEWANGTALYYWLLDPTFGVPPVLSSLAQSILSTATVSVLTWSVLAIEFSLFAALVAGVKVRRALFILGLGMHCGIWLLQGLGSFVFSTGAGLVLLLLTPRPGAE